MRPLLEGGRERGRKENWAELVAGRPYVLPGNRIACASKDTEADNLAVCRIRLIGQD